MGLRLDLGQKAGEIIEVKDIKAVKLKSDAPLVLLDRTLHTYSDKLHQELHFVAPDGQDNIDALGMITEIPENTVAKLIVKDANVTHTSLDNVDWSTVEYVAFDINAAGIFGYIMPYDGKGGSIKVTLADGVYTIIQEASPEGGRINSPKEAGDTSNDFFMGQRIYTDETHDFAKFIKQAEWERNPIKGIQSDKYVGYDSLRGAYLFSIGGTTFNPAFFSSWNQHFAAEIKLRNNDIDRPIYIRTAATTGCLENAVLLNEGGMILPIALEVSKNFGEGEEPIMNYGDSTYGETVFPFVANQGERYEFTVLNLYQNWGKFPLKQLSSIAYYAPYYHLSIGITETTCISPWYVRGRTLWTLPDFRSQSAPYWFELEGDEFRNEPQHSNAGLYEIIQYTDSNGNYVASENYRNDIDSSGPVYAEVKMDYISDDGKMKITYNHLELPQTDELRPFYEINIEILEDISFKNFKNDFAFYSWNTTRTHVGYLDENGNDATIAYSATDDITEYVLGKLAPYFGNYGTSSNNATNLGLVIHSSEIYFGGKLFDGNFVVVEEGADRFRLSLDIGEVTFKKGDTVTLNIIMIPWGSHLSTDASNLATVRQNTVLDPYKVTAEVGEVIESTYMPRVRSTNGTSAEFTVSGGTNNAAIRVYGFKKLTAPKIYEKIDGEWVEYTVSSIDSPDSIGIKHYYDGYMTYYDGNGTYSYAFAFNMDGVESRSFKIEAIADFIPWPEETVESNDPINIYLDPAEIAAKFQNSVPGVGSATISDDASYVRLTGDGKNVVEVRIDAYSALSETPTGQYLVVKYRMPTNSPANHFEFFTSTVNTSTKRGDSVWLSASYTVKDGEWHVLVVDAGTYVPSTFAAADDGKYYAQYMSFDVFNTPMGSENYVDIGYVGMCEDLNEFRALEANKGIEKYTFAAKNKTETYSMTTGELISSNQGGGTPSVTPTNDGITVAKNGNEIVSANSTYSLSTESYIGRIDYINGYGPNFTTGTAYKNRGSDSHNGIATVKFNGKTTSDGCVVISGWNLVYGGVSKYVWSIDGENWLDATYYNRKSLSAASQSMVNSANKGLGKDFSQFTANSSYQGETVLGQVSGIAADLSAYVGQTVNVTIAVVPASEPNTVCILAHLTDVEVVVGEQAEEETNTHTGAPDEVENPYNDPIKFYLDPTEMNDALKSSIPKGTGSISLADDGSYIRFYGDGQIEGESFFYAYSTTAKVATGKYIVVKFRMPATNTESNYLQIFASTVNESAKGSDSIVIETQTKLKDDAWHVIIIDAADLLPSSYIPEGGRYYAKYVRLDMINTKMSADSYIDIAYFGITDDLDTLRLLPVNSDVESMTFVMQSRTMFINVKTGEITDTEGGTSDSEISYIFNPSSLIAADNAQGYTASDTNYFARVDSINGFGPSGSTSEAYDMGSNDKNGVASFKYSGRSTSDKKIVFAGWNLILGGVEKYVWSADGGKTWHDVIVVGISSISSASEGILNYTKNKYGSGVDFSPYTENSSYQGNFGTPTGIGADLKDYAGQTVNVTFAAVSAQDNSKLCILLHLEGVTVAE